MDDKLFAFNYTRNRDKLFSNLVSIIDGILADGEIKNEEILYLDTWLLEASLIERNAVIKGLKRRVRAILEDCIITEQEKRDLKTYLNEIQKDIIDIPDVDFYSKESDLHMLNGLCKGLVSDRGINELEARYLDWWLSQNGALKNNYPGRELYTLVKGIFADGRITTKESATLHQALVDFTGCDLDSGVVDGLATRLPINNDAEIVLPGKTFCLTGTFISGKRSSVAGVIESLGGSINDSINKKLNYLVIGTLSSRDWRFSSHGRKIEKAVDYRDNKNLDLFIISEEMLIEVLP